MPDITRKTAGGGNCDDDHCPALWDSSDPEMTAITITLPQEGDDLSIAGPDAPGEITGFVPTALLRAWASGQQ